jgi:hypothetical protein
MFLPQEYIHSLVPLVFLLGAVRVYCYLSIPMSVLWVGSPAAQKGQWRTVECQPPIYHQEQSPLWGCDLGGLSIRKMMRMNIFNLVC